MTQYTKKRIHSAKRLRQPILDKTSNIKLKPTNIVVVGKIYAVSCIYCKALLPEWEKMVEFIETKQNTNPKSNTKYIFSEIEQSKQDADIANINNTYLKGSSDKLALQDGFPTLFKIYNGRLEYYNGDRIYLEMLRWYTTNKSNKPMKPNGIDVVNTEIEIIPKYEGGKSRNNRRLAKYSRKKRSTKRGLFSFFFS